MIPVFSKAKPDLALKQVESLEAFDEVRAECSDKVLVAFFYAEWHEGCVQIKELLSETSKVHKRVRYVWLDADSQALSQILERFGVESVPSFGVCKPGREDFDLWVDPEVSELTRNLDQLEQEYTALFEQEKENAFKDIKKLVTSSEMFVFMKGDQHAPKCKFSKKLMASFKDSSKGIGYKFGSLNILADERIRQWLKFYSNWPTFPQVFVKGEFQGGVDVVCELIENEEFDEIVPASCKRGNAQDELKDFLTQHTGVLAFIHGSLKEQDDDSSKALVELLVARGVIFTAIDLKVNYFVKPALALQDQANLYINGAPSKSVEELKALSEDDFLALLPEQFVKQTLNQKLGKLIKKAPIMVFIKGTKESPVCGFSQKIVGILNKYEGVFEYETFDILQDNEVREGLKVYSKWPTFPQVYSKGKLVGGVDIIAELDENAELEDELV